MTFARRVFGGAGIWGLLVVPPLYFLYDVVGEQHPPAVTHPEFFYGFTDVTLAWQFAFLVIASDPIRFRALMLPSMLEKFGWVVTLLILYAQGRLPLDQLAVGAPDLLLGLLFIAAFLKTAPQPLGTPRVSLG